MRDICREIQENLDRIENTYGVRILLAVESGSRAWALLHRTVTMMAALYIYGRSGTTSGSNLQRTS